MQIKEAIVKRIDDICEEQGKSVCEICLRAGMNPNAIYELKKAKNPNTKIKTIFRFCEGAGITLGQFFTTDYFDTLELEYD